MNAPQGNILLWSLAPRPGPTEQPVGSSAGMPQAKQVTRQGTQPHPSAGRLPKDILSLQPLLDMPLDTVLPTRGPKPSSNTSGQALAPPARKPLQASKPA